MIHSIINIDYLFPHTICRLRFHKFCNHVGLEYTLFANLSKRCMWVSSCEAYVNINTMRPRQNGRQFADIFKFILLNENVCILITISLKFVPKGSISNIPALVQIMAWCRLGDKPLYKPMLACSPTHICVSRHQWVNQRCYNPTWIPPDDAVTSNGN